MEEVGKNLKRIRLLKNLSLKEAGSLLNMSAPAVSKYEKGEIIKLKSIHVIMKRMLNLLPKNLEKIINYPLINLFLN